MAVSSSQTNTNVTFDLSSQVGVLQALYAVRTSELPSSKKNELRDDIFTYTKSGGDARMREQLESQLEQIPLSEEFLTKKAATKNQGSSSKAGLNMGRQAPQFSVPSTPSSFTPQSVQDEQTVPESQKTTPQPSQEQPVQPVSSTGTESVATNAPAPSGVQADSAPPTATPKVNQSDQPTQIPKQETAPEPAAVESTVSAPVQANVDTSINRIREIKRAVNNAVGNPVNLVDIDNTLGRQYMSALLKAMQSVNAETGEAGVDQMQELENTYQAILPILNRESSANKTPEVKQQTANVPQPPKAPAERPAPTVEQTPAPEPEPVSESLSQDRQVQTEVPTTPEPAPAPNQAEQTVPASQPADNVVSNGGAVNTQQPAPSQTYVEPSQQPTTPQASHQASNVASAEATTGEESRVEQPVSAEREAPPATRPTPTQTRESQANSVPLKRETQTAETPEPKARKDSGSFRILPIAQEEKQSKVDYGATQKTTTRRTPTSETAQASAVTEKAPSTPPTAQEPSTSKAETTPEWTNKADQKPATSTEEDLKQTPSLKQQTEGETIDAKLDTLKKQNQSQQAQTDPLYSPEIDAGLEQLLQEWSIFKSSGLFGTGPNGRDHPLFKKIAPLMVQDVAAGRFEDARPEVVQSISDYMNGWRYEQGIVYQPGETFETYLRRVIKFILTGKP